MAVSGGVNPARAQTGSGLTGGCPAQLGLFAPLTVATDVCAAGGRDRPGCCRLLLHATNATSETTTAASAARYRCVTQLTVRPRSRNA
jgi:hypothetical protein